MKQKDLLFVDLSARLPYGVIVQVKDWTTLDAELKTGHIRLLQEDKIELKPYLRSLSSMTEEEKREYVSFIGGQKPFDSDFSAYPKEYRFVYEWDVVNYINWLNSHHFDYRGLIEKGLAIEAPEGMYEI